MACPGPVLGLSGIQLQPHVEQNFFAGVGPFRAILESLGHMLARPGTVLWSLLGIQLQAHAGPSKTNKLFWREPIWGAIFVVIWVPVDMLDL